MRAVAQDIDFPDFRNKKDNFAKVSDKDIRADVASFALAGVDESIGKAQLTTVPVVGPSSPRFSMPLISVRTFIRVSATMILGRWPSGKAPFAFTTGFCPTPNAPRT